MKTFAYTYRAHSGALKQASLQALDRHDALRQIKATGCVPVSVTEGNAAAPGAGVPWNRTAWLAVAGVVLIAGLGVWLFSGPKTKRQTVSTNPSMVKSQAVDKPTSRSVSRTQVTKAPRSKVEVADPVTVAGETQKKVVAKQVRNVAAVTPPDEPTEEKKAKHRNLSTASEQLIAMLGRPGEDRPPLPLIAEDDLIEDFEKASTNLIYFDENDDEKTFAHKENVAWVKEYIKEAKNLGWTPGEYLRELEVKRMEEAAERNAAYKILAEIEAEMPAEAPAAREVLNKELKNKGIIPLDEPVME